jgi:hypothetical protein
MASIQSDIDMRHTLKNEPMNRGPFDVSRKIPLAPAAAEALHNAVRHLTAVDSILDAHVDRHGQLRISYDTSRLGIRDIKAMLDKAGIACAPGAWWRLKSAWYSFLDENAHANARSQGGACCNRPPSAHGTRDDASKME